MSIGFILLSFFAGILTILAPCMLPLLPTLLAGGIKDTHKWRPYVIIASLAVSILVFTIFVKATTLLIDVPTYFWTILSGVILVLVGIVTLFPKAWAQFSFNTGFDSSSHSLLAKAKNSSWIIESILIGVALGPVFSSCSPTYGTIIAVILPSSFLLGLFYLIIYILGFVCILVAITIGGTRLTKRLAWLSNPNSNIKKYLGILLIIIGLIIIFGIDKQIESFILSLGLNDLFLLELKLKELF